MKTTNYNLAIALGTVGIFSDCRQGHDCGIGIASVSGFVPFPTTSHHLKSKMPVSNSSIEKTPGTKRTLQFPIKRDDNDDIMGNNNDNNNEPVFYDDFDFSPGINSNSFDTNEISTDISASNAADPSGSDTVAEAIPQQLSEILQQTINEENKRISRITKNWNSGNWKCRGFSLDKYNPLAYVNANVSEGESAATDVEPSINSHIHQDRKEDKEDLPPTHVTKIAFDETALGPGFGTTSESIAVGRTDGTVYIVKLGDEYLTKFHAVPKVSMDNTWDGKGMDDVDKDNSDDNARSNGGSTVRIGMEMISEKERKERSGMASASSPEDELAEGSSSTPFEIECQFQAHGKDEPIASLLFHDDTLFTTAKKGKGGNYGMIKVWRMNDTSANTNISMIPVQNLDDAHGDEVVVLKTLSSSPSAVDVSDHNLLLSASMDGSIALWDMDGLEMVYRCELLDDDGNPTSITCADVDTSGDEHIIYLGLSSGHVVGYVASELVGDASVGNTCPVPKCRFIAHDPLRQTSQVADISSSGVTAISCGGQGSTSISASSSILLTGGADGVIKQWEMIQQRSSRSESPGGESEAYSWNLVYWPRLPTQRMKDRAHLFQGHSEGPVTSLVCDSGDAPKILSAGSDGTIRVWDPSKGELYRMDGFDNVSSICLDREILVTNGMKEYVCIHDFDVSEDDCENGYDLDW